MTVKNNRNLVIGIALLIIGVIGLGTLPGMGMTMGGMMGMRHDIKAPSDNELHTLALYLQSHAK